MNNLPVEILHHIFIHLELKQRITCMLVCRTWWRIFDAYSLLRILSIKDVQFPKFMEMIKQSPHRAGQVEELRLFTRRHTGVSTHKLYDIFPSARVIEIVLYAPHDDSDPFYLNSVGNSRSKSKVESLSDVYYCDLVLQMVQCNVCDRLETLQLDSIYNSCYVLSKLKNLHILKRLKLSRISICTRELEVIHENIPSILDFSIHNVTLDFTGIAFDIAPNTSITNFSFHIPGNQVLRSHVQFYQYMTKKYTNVADIQCRDDSVSTHFLAERQELYLDGILEFLTLRGVANDGRYFLQEVPGEINVFESFDAGATQLNKLHMEGCRDISLFEALGYSNQAKYIQTLYLESCKIEPPTFLKNMSTLVTLQLNRKNPRKALNVYLNDLINACPDTLKNLSIHSSYIYLNGHSTGKCSIENLDIDCLLLPPGLGDIISCYFPKLTKLKLQGMLNRNLSLVLLNHSFQEASIYLKGAIGYKCGIYFESSSQTQPQIYLCNEGVDSRISSSLDDIKNLPILSVVTGSEKKLEFIYSDSETIKVVNI